MATTITPEPTADDHDPDYFTTTLAATDEYGRAASIEITANDEGTPGVLIATTTAHQYAMVDLTPEQLDEMIAALTAARAVLTR